MLISGPKKFIVLSSLCLIAGAIWLYNQPEVGEESPAPTTSASQQTREFVDDAIGQSVGVSRTGFSDFRVWMDSYLEGEHSALFVQQGKDLAKRRRSSMLSLIQEEPELALKVAIGFAEYASLPKEIQDLVEQPYTSRGDVEIVVICDEDSQKSETEVNIYFEDSGRLRTGEHSQMRTGLSKLGIPLQGIRMDGWTAVEITVFKKLEGADADWARDILPSGNSDNSLDFLTGELLGPNPITTVAGGYYFLFSDEKSLQVLEEELGNFDDLPGKGTGSSVIFEDVAPMTQAAGFPIEEIREIQMELSINDTTGSKTVLFIRIVFPDDMIAPVSKADLEAQINGPVSGYLSDYSYGRTSLTATVSEAVYTSTKNGAEYETAYVQLWDEAVAAYQAHGNSGDPFNDYDVVGIIFPRISASWAGRGTVGGANSKQWLNGAASDKTIVHEFGHNYGLLHSNYWDFDANNAGSMNPVDFTGKNEEYGDLWDVMGRGGNPDQAHFHMAAKRYLSWLDANQIATINEAIDSGTYRVFRFDHEDAVGLQGLEIKKGDNENYWVGFRRAVESAPNYYQGAYVLWERRSAGSDRNQGWVIDTTPETYGIREDAGITVGRTYSDTAAGVHITPIALGGTNPGEYLDMVVNYGEFPGNAPPEVSLEGPVDTVVGTTVIFTANASDPNGDDLAYTWDLNDQTLYTSSASVSRTFSQSGIYEVSVTVSDMKGGTTKSSAQIAVYFQAPPEIEVDYSGTILANGDDSPSSIEGTDFGSQDVNRGNISRTFRVHNNGESSLTLVNPTSTNSQFIVKGLASVISGGSYDDFTVSFDPHSSGSKYATIIIPNSDSDENPFNFTVLGSGEGLPFIYNDLEEVEAGAFAMGSPNGEAGRLDNEIQHGATLTRPFRMAITEVTNAQVAEVFQWAYDQGHILMPDPDVVYDGKLLLKLSSAYGHLKFSDGNFLVESGYENYPMVEVSWYGAVAYAHFRSLYVGMESCYDLSSWSCDFTKGGFRLPTESEWEYACRAGTTTSFHAGDILYTGSDPLDASLDAAGWYKGNSGGLLQEVGQKSANDWGLKDMHGNVWEWCWDRFGDYPTGNVSDPLGSGIGDARVNRGGSYDADAWLCRSALRGQGAPENTFQTLGFRVVLNSNTTPIAVASSNAPVTDYDGDGAEWVTFDGGGSISNPEASIVSWQWDWEGLESPINGEIVEAQLPKGVTEVTLTVTNTLGDSGTDTVSVKVNEPPVAVGSYYAFSVSPGLVGTYLSISGSHDPDGVIVNYEWTLIGPVDREGTQGVRTITVSIGAGAPPIAGFFSGFTEVFLKATDEDGGEHFDMFVVTVAPVAIPNAIATSNSPVVDYNGDGFESVTLDGSASTPGVGDGDILLYKIWDWEGLGEAIWGDIIEAEFPVGITEVTLTVQNNIGKTDTDTILVQLDELPDEPPGFVLISEGIFSMGDSNLRNVSISQPFWMSETEVTNEQFIEVMQWAYDEGHISVTYTQYPDLYVLVVSGEANMSFESLPGWMTFSDGTFSVLSGRENMAVEEVSWYGAVAYAHFLSLREGKDSCYNLSDWTCDFSKDGYRLPTEAEWEYAARGGLPGKLYPWGDGIDSTKANYDSHYLNLLDVGSFEPNGYGLYDMAGGVWEWCWDWHGTYPSGSEIDPQGPASGTEKINRGGAWDSPALHCRVSQRGKGIVNTVSSVLGFRVALGTHSIVYHNVDFIVGEQGTRTGGGGLSQSVIEGASAIEPDVSTNEGYRFDGWDIDFSNVTSDLTVTAQYTEVHTVTFVIGDHGTRTGGGELTQQIDDGGFAVGPEVTANSSYRFDGWDVAFSDVTSDLNVTAQYTQFHTVAFVVGVNGTRTGGGELVQQVADGDSAAAPQVTANEGYRFDAWDMGFSNVTSDLTVTAQYTQLHTVTFVIGDQGTRTGGGELIQQIDDGGFAVAPQVTASEGYRFDGWDTFFSIVTDDLEIRALYEPAADHSPILSGSDFPPGGSVHLMVEFPAESPDGVNGLGVSIYLPDGWSFISDTAPGPLIRPQQGDEGTIEWAWLSAPDYPFTISFNIAPDSDGDSSVMVSGSALYTDLSNQQQERNIEEIVLFPVTRHSADSNENWAIELAELLKVIGLYNTREGSIRTGSFHCDGQSELGYSAGLGNQTCTIHSSDFSPMDWKINLSELLRLILLYNYREDATRTGQYHLDTDQIDGFAPGPETIPDVPSGFPGKLTNTPLKYAAEEGDELAVTSDSTLYLEKGGQVTLNIPVFYDETIASLGLELDIPSGWNFESDNTTATVVKPQQGETTSTLGWAWVEGFPENGSTIQVVLGYPSGLGGEDVQVGGRLYVNTASLSYSPLTLMRAYELSLVASPEDGGIVSGAGVFEAGSNALISAMPQSGYRFAGWSGEGVTEPDQQETVVSLSKDLVVTAHFERQFSLTVHSPFGLVDIDPKGVIYPSGDAVVLNATPFDGIAFKQWTVDGITQTNNPLLLLMDQDRVVTAHYELNVSEEYLEFIGSGNEPLELVEPKGDIDFDGIPNFVEFVTGVDNGGKPPAELERPVEAGDGSTDQITYSFVFAADPTLKRGKLAVCVSHDLINWEEQSIISFESNQWSASNEPAFEIGPTTAEIDSGGAWRVEVLYTVDKSKSKDRTFFWLKAME